MMRIRRTPHIMLTRPPARIGLSWSLVAMLALLLAGNARPATAGQDESLPARVTLAQVLELLDQRSPRTIAERARVDIVAADRITARTLPNPSISYGGLRLAAGANLGAVMQHELVVDQPLLLYGVRGSRRDVADLNVSAEQARVAADLADGGCRYDRRLSRSSRASKSCGFCRTASRSSSVPNGRTWAGRRRRPQSV
jgi:hypothetical protein